MKVTEKENEEHIIKQILHNKQHDTAILNKVSRERTTKEQGYKQWKSPAIWVKFRYAGKQTNFITKLLKNSNLKISCNTKILWANYWTWTRILIHTTSANVAMYQLACSDCNRKYNGQTGRPFHVRFKEHFRDYKHGNRKSKFAQNLLDNKHSISSMEDMENLQLTRKVGMMTT